MTEDILEEVIKERINQDEVYGMPRNDHPDTWLRVLVEEVGEFAMDLNDHIWRDGLYRTDRVVNGKKQNMRNELVQIAAVAVAALEDLDYQFEQKEDW